MVFVPLYANADNISIGGVLKISGGGSLVFPDGSVQYSAAVQGPKGDKGDTGAMGPQGPPGTTASSFEQLDYYALGDSITFGSSSTSEYNGYGYADILNAKLKFNSFSKLAVAGATAMPISGRPELATQIESIGSNASIITVLIGVNDYLSGNPLGDVNTVLSKPYASLDKTISFSEAFRYCLETIKRNHEEARIYVILPLQTTRIALAGSLDEFRYAEIKIAGYFSIPVIYANTESGLWTGGTLFPDGLHPNDTGYTILANYLARRLSSL